MSTAENLNDINSSEIISNVHIFNLLQFINSGATPNTPYVFEQLKKDFLGRMSRLRKYSKEDGRFIEKGLNIFDKKGIAFDDLYENVKPFINRDGEIVTLNENGVDFLNRYYTDDYSDEYFIFKKRLHEEIVKAKVLPFPESSIPYRYYDFKSSKKPIDELYCKTLSDQSVAYHRANFKAFDLVESDDTFIFHIVPKIILPFKDMNCAVNLALTYSSPEGSAIREEISLKKPYPNKRWYVGTVKKENRIISGLYFSIPKEKRSMQLTFTWKIFDSYLADPLRIEHNLDFIFNCDTVGNLFSTEQDLLYNSDIPRIRVYTPYPAEENISFMRDSPITRKCNFNGDDGIYKINETVILNKIPYKIHYVSSADQYYQKWVYENFRQIKEINNAEYIEQN